MPAVVDTITVVFTPAILVDTALVLATLAVVNIQQLL